MPANKQKKVNTRRTRKERSARTRARNSGPQMMGAPAGISQDLQQKIRFSSAGQNGIRMHVCIPVYNVLSCSSTFRSGGALQASSVPTMSALSAQLNLTNPRALRTATASSDATVSAGAFISPIFDLIASAFVRYRVEKLRFDYEPQASSTEKGRLVFAYANDPSHPILWSSTAPTQSDLLSMSDSIAFAPWRSWSMDVSHRLQNQVFYTYANTSSLSSAEDRFSDFGVISCLTSNGTAVLTDEITSGVLYMSVQIELSEFCPISVSRPSMALHLSKALDTHQTSSKPPGKPESDDHVLEALTDQALIDYHLSMQAKVDGPVLGDAYRMRKHATGVSHAKSSPTSEEVAATARLTASSIEISKLKSQLDELKYSKTS